jgi:hypothetical protein
VQFVPFNKFNGNPAALAKEVLAEIPDQFLTYYRMQNIMPKPAAQVNLNNLLMSTMPP